MNSDRQRRRRCTVVYIVSTLNVSPRNWNVGWSPTVIVAAGSIATADHGATTRRSGLDQQRHHHELEERPARRRPPSRPGGYTSATRKAKTVMIPSRASEVFMTARLGVRHLGSSARGVGPELAGVVAAQRQADADERPDVRARCSGESDTDRDHAEHGGEDQRIAIPTRDGAPLSVEGHRVPLTGCRIGHRRLVWRIELWGLNVAGAGDTAG